MKVDFMIVGAQKSGTTTLAYLLSQHPDVSFCHDKEPAFFNRYPDWRERLDDYHRLYQFQPGRRTGEASTMYSFLPEFKETSDRIRDYNPEMRIIYLMRDPVERIVSHYAHRYVRGRVAGRVGGQVLQDPTYVNRSRYHWQVSPYLRCFGKDQVRLLIFEEFLKEPAAGMASVCDFLDLKFDFYKGRDLSVKKNGSAASDVMTDHGKAVLRHPMVRRLPFRVRMIISKPFVRSIPKKPEFPRELRKRFYDTLVPDRQNLERLLGRPVNAWKRY